jgi:hypothetical protein
MRPAAIGWITGSLASSETVMGAAAGPASGVATIMAIAKAVTDMGNAPSVQ